MDEIKVASGITVRAPDPNDITPGWRVTLDLSIVRQKLEVGGPTQLTPNKQKLYWWLKHVHDKVSCARYVTDFWENIDGTDIELTL